MSITFRVLMMSGLRLCRLGDRKLPVGTTARTSPTNANKQFPTPIGLTRNEETKASR